MDNNSFILEAFMDACRTLVKYDIQRRQLYVLKSEFQVAENPDTPVSAYEYLQNFLKSGVVYKEDIPLFDRLSDNVYMRKLCDTHQNGALIVYRRTWGEKLIWVRLNLFVPSSYSDTNPYVVLFNRDMPAEEAMLYESWELLGQQVHKVVKANLTTDVFIPIKVYPNESYLYKNSLTAGFSNEMQFIKDGFVHPDDVPAFEKNMEHNYIRNFFREGHSEYQFYYRRRIKGLYRWVRLTILPASDYDLNNEVFYYYVSDVHKSILKLLDIRAATKYAEFFAERNQLFSEGYYENLLEILSTFTGPYIDYYLLDLEKDIYINYKISHNSINDNIPFIGNYTQITYQYLLTNYSGAEREKLLTYSSSKKLQELLKDKVTLEYTFDYPTGIRVTTTCVKIESRNGIPTKVICSTRPAAPEHRLLIRTFGNFEVLHPDGTPISFSRKQSKQLLAYLIDRQGYPVTSKDIVIDILEKSPSDFNAVKYVSTMVRRAMKDLEAAGYPDVIIKEQKSVRVNTVAVDCDYYHLMNGDTAYWQRYHNEYMKEYSWAEETNAELLGMMDL